MHIPATFFLALIFTDLYSTYYVSLSFSKGGSGSGEGAQQPREIQTNCPKVPEGKPLTHSTQQSWSCNAEKQKTQHDTARMVQAPMQTNAIWIAMKGTPFARWFSDQLINWLLCHMSSQPNLNEERAPGVKNTLFESKKTLQKKPCVSKCAPAGPPTAFPALVPGLQR